MISDAQVNTLVQWLTGEFTNQEQALKEPTWFVHLVLWHRRLPQPFNGCDAVFAEQANVLYPDRAYRQRVFTLRPQDGMIQAQYFGFKHPDRFKGAGLNPEILSTISMDDLDDLPGCVLEVKNQGDAYVGTMRTGDRCRFQYGDKTGEVALGFEVRADQFLSFDRGINPDTGQPIWGAMMGPYRFSKR